MPLLLPPLPPPELFSFQVIVLLVIVVVVVGGVGVIAPQLLTQFTGSPPPSSLLPRPSISPNQFPILVNWSEKAKRRKTTGTGRTRHLKTLPRRFKNGFREGTAAPAKRAAAAKA